MASTRPTTLSDLGRRICILGPSNSGKSSLAIAIARARAIPAIHLDQLFHLPNTDWHPRPEPDFLALHQAAIAAESWVIEGNYTRCLPQRLARATGVILLDAPTPISLFRYLRRCWFDSNRHGALEGGKDSVKFLMIRHITTTARTNRRRTQATFDQLALPKISLKTKTQQSHFYQSEHLTRQTP
jgi:adenylate kinase family enzyme